MTSAGWTVFAKLCGESFSECGFRDELIAECGGQRDLAWVAFYRLGQDSVPWLHRRIPALDGERPVDLIATGRADLVRDCLWGFPC